MLKKCKVRHTEGLSRVFYQTDTVVALLILIVFCCFPFWVKTLRCIFLLDVKSSTYVVCWSLLNRTLPRGTSATFGCMLRIFRSQHHSPASLYSTWLLTTTSSKIIFAALSSCNYAHIQLAAPTVVNTCFS